MPDVRSAASRWVTSTTKLDSVTYELATAPDALWLKNRFAMTDGHREHDREAIAQTAFHRCRFGYFTSAGITYGDGYRA